MNKYNKYICVCVYVCLIQMQGYFVGFLTSTGYFYIYVYEHSRMVRFMYVYMHVAQGNMQVDAQVRSYFTSRERLVCCCYIICLEEGHSGRRTAVQIILYDVRQFFKIEFLENVSPLSNIFLNKINLSCTRQQTKLYEMTWYHDESWLTHWCI